MRRLGSMAIKALMGMATAVAGVIILGATNDAQAGAKAFSDLEVTNFIVSDTSGTQLLATDFSAASVNDTGQISGALTGETSFVTPGVNIDDCIGDTCGAIIGDFFGMNDFDAGHQFSRAANLISGTIVTPVTGVSADTASEVIISETSLGLAESVTGTGISFEFSMNVSQALVITFDAAQMFYLELHQEDGFVFASSAWSITITDPNFLVVLSWSPDGAGGGISCPALGGCFETLDAFLMTTSRSLTDTLGPLTLSPSGPFSATTGVLAANTTYQLTIAHEVNVSADATKVPEPTTLGLFGIGLLGLGLMMGWRRRRETAA